MEDFFKLIYFEIRDTHFNYGAVIYVSSVSSTQNFRNTLLTYRTESPSGVVLGNDDPIKIREAVLTLVCTHMNTSTYTETDEAKGVNSVR